MIKVEVHCSYNADTEGRPVYDIALLQLDMPLPEYIQPATLDGGAHFGIGVPVIVVGWGALTEHPDDPVKKRKKKKSQQN